mgnify:CR=1 FL=1
MTGERDPVGLGQMIAAGAIAAAGLVVSFGLGRILPEFIHPAISGAVTGAFGILALQRIWPGLPLTKIHFILGAIILYGLVVGLAGRL